MNFQVLKGGVFDCPSAYWHTRAQKETCSVKTLQKICDQVNLIWTNSLWPLWARTEISKGRMRFQTSLLWRHFYSTFLFNSLQTHEMLLKSKLFLVMSFISTPLKSQSCWVMFLICPYKHLSESFVSSPVTYTLLHIYLCSVYRLTNYNDFQSLAFRYFPY